MVKPSISSVKKVMKKIRKGKLATLDIIRNQLAKEFKVQTACPNLTMKAIHTLSEEDDVYFWRIVRKKRELIEKFRTVQIGMPNYFKKKDSKSL